jgi:hyaluronan synthase
MDLMYLIIFSIAAFVLLRNVIIGVLIKLRPRKLLELPKKLPTISVVIPSFNEGKGIYQTLQSLSKADYPADLFDVVVVDDCSTDDTVEWILKAILEFSDINIKHIVQPVNSGKQQALIAGFHCTSGNIFVLFDSDVVVDPNVFKGFVRELQDPGLGIVGASCGVYDPNRDMISQGYASVFYSLHEFLKQVESSIGCISVVDGKAMGFRREIYEKMLPVIANRSWLNLQVMAGEDRHITHELTLLGYKSRVILERVNTSAPPDLISLYKQQLRWRRSGLRNWFSTVGDLPNQFAKIGVYKTISNLLPRAVYLLLPLIYAQILLSGGAVALVQAHISFIIFILSLKLIMNLHARIYQPDQVIENPILSSLTVSAWMLIDHVITTPLALFTMDETGWGTRNLNTSATLITSTTKSTLEKS